MADEVLGALNRGLSSRASSATPPVQLYAPPPPTLQSLPSLRELRRTHRNRLAPRSTPTDAAARWVPEPFDSEIGLSASGAAGEMERGHVLERLSPLRFLSSAAADGGGGDFVPPTALALPPLTKHPASRSVVAKKMLSRLDADLRWLSDEARTASAAPLLLQVRSPNPISPRSPHDAPHDLPTISPHDPPRSAHDPPIPHTFHDLRRASCRASRISTSSTCAARRAPSCAARCRRCSTRTPPP